MRPLDELVLGTGRHYRVLISPTSRGRAESANVLVDQVPEAQDVAEEVVRERDHFSKRGVRRRSFKRARKCSMHLLKRTMTRNTAVTVTPASGSLTVSEARIVFEPRA